MKKRALDLIEDFDLYPRTTVDSLHVARIADSLAAGETVPAIIVDPKGRVIDGLHRRRAALRVWGDDAMIECEVRTYANDKDAYLDAVRLNARHGKAITG